MAYVAVYKDGKESIHEVKPSSLVKGYYYSHMNWFEIPKGSIEKLIGKKLTWDDEPVKLKEG
jgi:hypothetical protein